ncbi:MAG: DUF4142 domain-containing protein [Leadbetterella sp.]|nr:DUF4142 domain-containing protein [Leadbetterella sp.]
MKNYILPFALGMSVSMVILTRALNAGRNLHSFTQNDDMQFAKNAIEDGRAEVMFGNLALEQGYAAPVRKFAKMLVSDHQKANNELEKLLKRKGYTDLPDGPSVLAKEHHERIGNLSGAEFDKAFARQMVEDHEKTINVFLRQIEKGEDKQLVSWARKTLPTLQNHLAHARNLVEILN